MIRLIQRRLIIPRGDTGTFTVPLITKGDTGDVALFSIFDLSTKRKVFEKIVYVTGDTFTVEFNHNDTVNLPAGKYAWDIKFYQNPEFADGVLINGTEIDSYYAAYDLPVCEIRETGDLFLTADDAPTSTLPPESLNIISAAVSEVTTAKDTSTVNAGIAANAATTAHEDAEAASAAAARIEGLIEQLPEIPTKVSDLIDDSGHYTKPETGIPAADLAETYLTSFTETDPTVPAWAKASTKPAYTAQEVGALPADTVIPTVPTNVSAFTNDAGYLTQHQDISGKANSADLAAVATSGSYNDLSNKPTIPARISDLIDDSNHYTKPVTGIPASDLQETYLTSFTETDPTVPAWAKAAQKPTYTATEVGATTEQQVSNMIASAIGNINSFDMAVVQTLPAENISNHTIYLVPKTGETNDVYDEYIYVNDAWEMIGNTQIDLSNYALKSEIPEAPVQDVQINETSIVSNGIANIQKASSSNLGVVGIELQSGVVITSSGKLEINPASTADIKKGENTNKPIVPFKQDVAAFYGLATAAGDTTQATSNNAVGTYTDEAKASIRTMLNVPSTSDITVSDVQVNGTSILSNGIANIPIASSSALGLVKINQSYGVIANPMTGELTTWVASSDQIKAGMEVYRPIMPTRQHEATFYGLAKAAGDTTQSQSDNAVGTYTDAAKTAIQTMLGVPSTSAITVSDVQINNASIINNKIATIPLAGESRYGVIKVGNGLSVSSGIVSVYAAVNSQIKEGTNTTDSIVPYNQHAAAFYGLAKAAGDTTQSSSNNAIGTYTDGAKTAIRTMLGVPSTSDIPSVPVQDVQIEDTSIISDGIASIPRASSTTYGVVKINISNGISIGGATGTLMIVSGGDTSIKLGSGAQSVITADNQHKAVFYGLAKVAGDTTQSASSNTVGTYTAEAKNAIQNMLGISSSISLIQNVTGTTPTIVGQPNMRYVCGTVSTLSITAPSTGTIAVQFNSGTTATVLTVTNSNVKWPIWFDPTSLAVSTTYMIMITDGTLGAVMTWAQ